MIVFHKIAALESSDPMWYNALTSNLSPEQQTALREVLVLADQRKAAAESKKIEQSGGKPLPLCYYLFSALHYRCFCRNYLYTLANKFMIHDKSVDLVIG